MLQQRLKPHFSMYDPRFPPNSLINWKPSMSERPDVVIKDIKNSVVIEVKATEIIHSD